MHLHEIFYCMHKIEEKIDAGEYSSDLNQTIKDTLKNIKITWEQYGVYEFGSVGERVQFSGERHKNIEEAFKEGEEV